MVRTALFLKNCEICLGPNLGKAATSFLFCLATELRLTINGVEVFQVYPYYIPCHIHLIGYMHVIEQAVRKTFVGTNKL